MKEELEKLKLEIEKLKLETLKKNDVIEIILNKGEVIKTESFTDVFLKFSLILSLILGIVYTITLILIFS